jgi:hypothetical protein
MKGERAGAAIEMYEIFVANVEVEAFEMERPFEMKRNMSLSVNENRDKTFVNEMNKMTGLCGGIEKNEMTALCGGIERNEMTALCGGIEKNKMTALVSGGIEKNKMTALVSGGMAKNEMTTRFGNGIKKLKKETKLKKDEYEQRRVLERVALTHFVLGSTYDTDDLVSHGSEDMSHGRNKNSDARLHDQNSASAKRFSGSYLNRGAPSVDTTDEDRRRNK